jgi:hypothetical protein
MKHSTPIALSAAALVCTAAGAASAQDLDTVMRSQLPAPRQAFELGIDTGYTQGFGLLEPNRPLASVADAGFTVGGHFGVRMSPMASVGLAASYHTQTPDARMGSDTDLHGMVVSVEATGHFLPTNRIDPFITIGGGYRALWIVPPGTADNRMVHGFQLGKINAGFDMRATKDIAIGPFIGADVNLFVWNDPEDGPNAQLARPVVSTFIYAGVQGRFDVGGTREMPAAGITTTTGRAY